MRILGDVYILLRDVLLSFGVVVTLLRDDQTFSGNELLPSYKSIMP